MTTHPPPRPQGRRPTSYLFRNLAFYVQNRDNDHLFRDLSLIKDLGGDTVRNPFSKEITHVVVHVPDQERAKYRLDAYPVHRTAAPVPFARWGLNDILLEFAMGGDRTGRVLGHRENPPYNGRKLSGLLGIAPSSTSGPRRELALPGGLRARQSASAAEQERARLDGSAPPRSDPAAHQGRHFVGNSRLPQSNPTTQRQSYDGRGLMTRSEFHRSTAVAARENDEERYRSEWINYHNGLARTPPRHRTFGGRGDSPPARRPNPPLSSPAARSCDNIPRGGGYDNTPHRDGHSSTASPIKSADVRSFPSREASSNDRLERPRWTKAFSRDSPLPAPPAGREATANPTRPTIVESAGSLPKPQPAISRVKLEPIDPSEGSGGQSPPQPIASQDHPIQHSSGATQLMADSSASSETMAPHDQSEYGAEQNSANEALAPATDVAEVATHTRIHAQDSWTPTRLGSDPMVRVKVEQDDHASQASVPMDLETEREPEIASSTATTEVVSAEAVATEAMQEPVNQPDSAQGAGAVFDDEWPAPLGEESPMLLGRHSRSPSESLSFAGLSLDEPVGSGLFKLDNGSVTFYLDAPFPGLEEIIKMNGGRMDSKQNASVIVLPLDAGVGATLPHHLELLKNKGISPFAFVVSHDWVWQCIKLDAVVTPSEGYKVKAARKPRVSQVSHTSASRKRRRISASP